MWNEYILKNIETILGDFLPKDLIRLIYAYMSNDEKPIDSDDFFNSVIKKDEHTLEQKTELMQVEAVLLRRRRRRLLDMLQLYIHTIPAERFQSGVHVTHNDYYLPMVTCKVPQNFFDFFVWLDWLPSTWWNELIWTRRTIQYRIKLVGCTEYEIRLISPTYGTLGGDTWSTTPCGLRGPRKYPDPPHDCLKYKHAEICIVCSPESFRWDCYCKRCEQDPFC